MRSSLTLALCLFLAGAAEAQDLNVISGVEVKDAGNSLLVTVKGSKPPNFTTFSMADPARFVIDLSESKFQGVPEDLRVDDGVIRVVKNLAYGSGATSIARVMIAFSVEVEPPDVQTEGNSLLVRVIKPGGGAVAAAGARSAGTTAAGPGTAGSGPGAPGASASGAAAAGAVAAAAAAAARSEAAEADRKEALAREQREAEAREQARVASEASAKEREAQARIEADARAREAEKLAAQQAAADEAARVAADARRAEIKAKAATEGAQPQKLQEGAAAGAAAATTAEADRAARAQAKADAKAKREIEEALAAQQAAEGGSRVAATPPPAAPRAEAPAAPAGPARTARLQAVGFKQLPTVSRVFVKTSFPSRFVISDVGDDVVRLEVENTRAARRNDSRPLDTSFFPSAVAMITPSRQGTSYVVDIKLKKRVPYQQKVEGDVVAIDFERPAGEPAAADDATARAPGTPAASAPSAETLENDQGLIVAPDEKAEGAEPGGDPEPAPKQ